MDRAAGKPRAKGSHRAARGARKPEEALHELRGAAAHEAREAHDLAARDLQGDVLEARAAEVVEREHALPRLAGLPGAALRDRGAHHHARDLAGRGVGDAPLGHERAVAQHRVGVAELKDLGHLVRDEDERGALVAQGPHDLEEVLDLGGIERRGGLVQDEQLGVEEERAADLQQLLLALLEVVLLALLEVGDERGGVDVHSQALKEVARLGDHGPLVEREERAHLLLAQEDVLVGQKVVEEVELLVDEGDARPLDGLDRGAGEVGAVKGDGAGVGGIGAGQDVHEGGLARAVLAEKGVDLPARNVEVDAPQDGDAAERLADAAHGEKVHSAPSVPVVMLPRGSDGARGRGTYAPARRSTGLAGA